jgi:hypothetical protein
MDGEDKCHLELSIANGEVKYIFRAKEKISLYKFKIRHIKENSHRSQTFA